MADEAQASAAAAAKPVVRRSRAGCAECRRRRRRCDEKKPACGYCVSTDQECKYVVRLSWGGRPFSRSIFGQCLDVDAGVAKIGGSEMHAASGQPFVYGTTQQSRAPRKEHGPTKDQDSTLISYNHVLPIEPPTRRNSTSSQLHVNTSIPDGKSSPSLSQRSSLSPTAAGLSIYNPSNYAWVPPQYRDLLDYFTMKMTRSISCFSLVQKDYCTSLLPMANSSPHLLSAVLYLAACHKTSRGLPQDRYETDHLRALSLRQLRLSLTTPSPNSSLETAIASTLTLCIADIVSEAAVPGSWRIHFEGALSLWAQMTKDPTYRSRRDTAIVHFLKRWYSSFETIAFSCGASPVKRPMSEIDDMRFYPEETDYIDDMTSFSTSLLPIFEEINKLRAAQAQAQAQSRSRSQSRQNSTTTNIDPRFIDLETPPSATSSTFEEEGQVLDPTTLLMSRVKHLLATRTPTFRSSISAYIPPTTAADYFTLDEAYHHMALLQLYALSSSPLASSTILHSISRIIETTSSLTFIDDPCPAVAILPPLFVAGVHAAGEVEQGRILGLLGRMEECWGMGNVGGCRGVLRRIWSARREGDGDGGMEGGWRWEEEIGGGDILPY